MKTKTLLTIGLTAMIGLTALTGCGSTTSPSTDTKGETITVMIPDYGVPPQDMLDQFKKDTGITVNVEVTAWDDIKSKVSVASAAQKAPADVMEVDWSWAGEFGNAGWLEAQTPDDATIKDIPAYTYFKVKDSYVAMPYVSDVRFAYWNHAMAEKAGITTVPTNAAELETDLLAIKQSGAVTYPFLFSLGPEEITTTSFITQTFINSGKVFNDDGTLNPESTLQTLTTLKRYLDEGLIDPNSVATKGLDVFGGIEAGTGAYLLGPTFYTTGVDDPKESKVVGQVQTMPIPTPNGPATYTVAFPEGLGISAYSEHKEAAKKFIEWYTAKDTQLKLSKAINNPPVRLSALEEQAKGENGKVAQAILQQLQVVKSPFPQGVPKNYTKISTEIFNVLHQFGQGQLTPQEATTKMVENVNAIVKSST